MLPRDWDAGRLLRFLTGLALLALAFAANAGLIATPAVAVPEAPATATTDDGRRSAPPRWPRLRRRDQPVITVAVIEIDDR